MAISQKCQYALRAVFELSKRSGQGPIPAAEIAEAQAIPHRFLESILTQLRQAGIMESQRGSRGGYVLASRPAMVTVGDIIRLVDGPIGPVPCAIGDTAANDPPYGDGVFLPVWRSAEAALAKVYDGVTFQDLVDEHAAAAQDHIPIYSI